MAYKNNSALQGLKGWLQNKMRLNPYSAGKQLETLNGSMLGQRRRRWGIEQTLGKHHVYWDVPLKLFFIISVFFYLVGVVSLYQDTQLWAKIT